MLPLPAALAPAALPALVLLPLVAAGAVWTVRRRHHGIGDAITLAATTVVALGTSLVLVAGPGRVAEAHAGGLGFAADELGALVAFLTGLVWWCASLFSLGYLPERPGRARYHIASLVTLAGMLGVALAGDLLTLFISFEVMGLTAWFLVTHSGTGDARRAGTLYLWMTLAGGGLLLGGVLISHPLSGGTFAATAAEAMTPGMRTTAAVLLVAGFGVKAGLLPLHVWLPGAHAAAPTPASAILSGILIKAGALGIIRTLATLFPGTALPPAVPGVLLWLGITAMVVGVIAALGQSHAKRMLAWSSISQMGIILAGTAVAAAGGVYGAMGLAGAAAHLFSHATLKACLFLGVGAVMHQTGTAELHQLGGLWRRMPVTFAIMVLAGAGLAGLPLFPAAVSKGLVHHALGPAAPQAATWGFVLASVGTAAVMTRLLAGIFLGAPGGARGPSAGEASRSMLLPIAVLAGAGLVTGIRPDLLLLGVVAPWLARAGADPSAIQSALQPSPGHSYLTGSELASSALVIGSGIALSVVAWRLGWLVWRPPAWAGLLHWYLRTGTALVGFAGHWHAVYGHLRIRTAWLGPPAGTRRAGWAYAWLRRATIGIRVLAGSSRTGDARETARQSLPRRPGQQGWRRLIAEPNQLAARRRLERYAGALGGNLAMIFVLFLVALALLAAWPER
jgi:formate hydrogenlyase subunit 3/multisubunit Na+/H+ antiporter MnhD subunit